MSAEEHARLTTVTRSIKKRYKYNEICICYVDGDSRDLQTGHWSKQGIICSRCGDDSNLITSDPYILVGESYRLYKLLCQDITYHIIPERELEYNNIAMVENSIKVESIRNKELKIEMLQRSFSKACIYSLVTTDDPIEMQREAERHFTTLKNELIPANKCVYVHAPHIVLGTKEYTFNPNVPLSTIQWIMNYPLNRLPHQWQPTSFMTCEEMLSSVKRTQTEYSKKIACRKFLNITSIKES